MSHAAIMEMVRMMIIKRDFPPDTAQSVRDALRLYSVSLKLLQKIG